VIFTPALDRRLDAPRATPYRSFMPPTANLIALVAMLVVAAIFLGPRLLAFIASHRGTEAEARVKHAELTSVMDERKRYAHRVVLMVTPPGGGPEFEATVTAVLPFMATGSPPVGTVLTVRYLPGMARSVHIVGPRR
jgi:hypothetical protein